MDYDNARAEIIAARDIASPAERDRVITRVSAEALVDIAWSLAILTQSYPVPVPADKEEANDVEPHYFVIGDRVRLLDPPDATYLVDAVRLDQGETALRLLPDEVPAETAEISGWVYASTVEYIDHPVDEKPAPEAESPIADLDLADPDESLDDAFAKLQAKAKRGKK